MKSMGAKSDRLVSEFFEKISWKILKDYPQIVNEMIQGKAGVYALYNGNSLYYVGLAANLKRRLKQHLKDRHAGCWSHFSVYLVCEGEHIKPLESMVLRIATPRGNRVKGKLPGAINKRKVIEQKAKDTAANAIAKMMGGSAAKKRIKDKVQQQGTAGLNGVVERSHALKTEYKGIVFKATLRKDGQIRFNGKLYASPTAAAMAATKRSAINGRAFWKYRNDAGKWVALSKLIG